MTDRLDVSRMLQKIADGLASRPPDPRLQIRSLRSALADADARAAELQECLDKWFGLPDG